MKINIKHKYKLLLLFLVVAFIAFGFLGDDKNGIQSPRPIYKVTATQESGKQGDAYGMNVNNIWLPINNKGIIADVNVPPNGSGGQYAGGTFLFSSGFFLSGYSAGTLWANAAASASLVEDYLPGPVGQTGNTNAVVYVVNSGDVPFGQSWQDWTDAVALGADFYDGNCDGIYNPVDLNGNGIFDPESFPGACDGEDSPDLIGDELVWCIYNDALPVAQRRWNTTIQVGIEIKQSVFAFSSAGAIGNLIFVRYRFAYKGLNSSSPETLTDVYFGAWADPDLGDAADDVIGVDTVRNAGYTYNNEPDGVYGNQVPCFMIDFFSGPRAYIAGVTYIDLGGEVGVYDPGIDTPLDTATSVQGQLKGIVYYPGAKNLPVSSFVMYINGLAGLSDPSNKNEARNYMLGLRSDGVVVQPCTGGNFPYGEVRGGVDCNLVDPRFWFSGDPVTDVGWICTENRDMRQMTNTGPFVLTKNQENEIVLAYVAGRGTNPLEGITVARAIDDGAQTIFDLNFLAPSPPPAPVVTLSSSDDFIDISWETPPQVKYVNDQPSWNLRFEGYQVWAFKTNIAEDFVSDQPNSLLLASYDLHDFIENVYLENSQNGGIDLLYPVGNQLDSTLYKDPATGRIRVRIFKDPFDPNVNVTKGKPYYFAVTSYALNYDALLYKPDPSVLIDSTTLIGPTGDYYLSSAAFAQQAENIRTINSIIVGESALNPPVTVQPANKISGASLGDVGYDVINNNELTGQTYEVTFFKNDTSTAYSMFWTMKNISTGVVMVDSSLSFTYGTDVVDQPLTDGFITKVELQNTTIGLPTYDPDGDEWYNFNGTPVDSLFSRGIYYLGTDLIPTGALPYPFNLSPSKKHSTFITSDKLRTIEIRFGEEGVGKAYRFLNGYKTYGIGTNASSTYPYAAAIAPSDTGNGKSTIGMWDNVNNRPFGFVDVPFTAWVVDPQNEEEYQIAVGFIEASNTSSYYPAGKPDGIWNPGTDIRNTGEYLILFDSPYDPNGGQIELTGGDFVTGSGTQTIWADFARWYNETRIPLVPLDAQDITDEQRNIFNSPYLSTMYFCGLAQTDSTSWFTAGDVMTIPLDVYPYTANDVYQFSTLDGTTLSSQDEQDMWNMVNVYPNPLYAYNALTSYTTNTPDEPWVTFTNLPEQITVSIYSLSGSLLRTLTTDDKASPSSPFLNWDLLNESGLRVASGMYLAIVSSPIYGDKTLKLAIIMPQKQIQRY